jgi:hypothetical protein
MKHKNYWTQLCTLLGLAILSTSAVAQVKRLPDVAAARVFEHWTPERRAAAIPRDLVIDERGLGYRKVPGGGLVPHGHATPAKQRVTDATPSPFGRNSTNDSAGPVITNFSPTGGSTIGSSATFSVTVTDQTGVRSVIMTVQKLGEVEQSFSMTNSGDQWSVSLQPFTDGSWQWWITATDSTRSRNRTVSDKLPLTVSTGSGSGGGSGGGGGTGDTVTNARWSEGGDILRAAGRIYFEMPSSYSKRRGYTWSGYVCSGTVVEDGVTGRSTILTAAHCAYDDVYKLFARNVMFIPNQDDGGTDKTDGNCFNDPIGCWKPAFAVVHPQWAAKTFPANIPWDYAYYVVNNVGAHDGNDAVPALDGAVRPMTIQFTAPALTEKAHALGYSYADDPNFMYCAEGLATESSYGDLWLGACGLSGGASGGPWVQPLLSGAGPLISVNSWGYTTQPGMGGPRLSTGAAACVFEAAKSASLSTSGGVVVASCQ